MRLNFAFERTHQEFTPLRELVDFPVALLFCDLNHAFLAEFFQVGVDVTAAQVKAIGEVVAVGRFLTDSPQDTEFGLRDKTHFSENADPQWKSGNHGITESQHKQISMKEDKKKNNNDAETHWHNE